MQHQMRISSSQEVPFRLQTMASILSTLGEGLDKHRVTEGNAQQAPARTCAQSESERAGASQIYKLTECY